MKVYIASSEKYIGKIQEDIYTRDALRAERIPSEIDSLKNIVKISSPFDVVILKSIWGYHKDYKEFLKKISNLKNKKIHLINDYDFIFWNVDKYKYLKEIRTIGIVPTFFLRVNDTKTTSDIRSLLLGASRILNASTIVVKPRISEGGYLTFLYDTKRRASTIVALQRNKNLDFIAQPYRSSISEGEISVVTINGNILYGIKRFPGVFSKKADSIYLPVKIIPTGIRKKLTALEAFFRKKFRALPNICRIDFLKDNSQYEISEVELIDPDLFFRYIPKRMKEKAIDLLCEAIKNK